LAPSQSFRRRSHIALTQPTVGEVVTEADLADLPDPVAAYVRQSGALGQPRVGNFHAHISGRIRGGATKPWMPFRGEQVNTLTTDSVRLFYIDATMLGFPLDVLHVFAGPSATMRVKVSNAFRRGFVHRRVALFVVVRLTGCLTRFTQPGPADALSSSAGWRPGRAPSGG
jgi:hypothetical protein